MNRVFSTRHLFVILLLAPLFFLSLGPGDDTVDFSLAPAQGLKFKMTRTVVVRATSIRTRGDTEVEMKMSADLKEVFSQTFLEVKQGKVRKLDREYEDFSGKMVVENEMLPEPRVNEEEGFLAWKHVRAAWDDDGEITHEVKEEEEWKGAGEKICKWLNAGTLLHPAFPHPGKVKKVGDSWDLDPVKVMDIIKGPSMKIGKTRFDGTTEVKLVDIRPYEKLECAVLEFTFDVESKGDDEEPELKMKGTAFYSLKHRIVVGMKASGSLKMSGERDRGEGTMKVTAKVKFLEDE